MPSRLFRTVGPTLLLFALPVAFALGAGASCGSGGAGGYPAISSAGGSTAAATTAATTTGTSASTSSASTSSASTSSASSSSASTSSASTSSGSTSSTGAGGADAGCAHACTIAHECPAETTLCKVPVCDDLCCGIAFGAKGTPCTDSGGNVCNGAGVCIAASCTDDILDGNETDVDCGGLGYLGAAPCPPCANGKMCAMSGANCESKVCSLGVCQVPTCDDGVQNGDETGVDCGGGSYMGATPCPPCG